MSRRSTQLELERRRAWIARNLARKMTQAEIAHLIAQAPEKGGLGIEVSQATISRDLKVIEQEWKDAYAQDIDNMRADELAELRAMEREAAASFAAATNSSQRASALRARLAVKERIHRLMGMDLPRRVDVTSDGQPLARLYGGFDPSDV